MEKDNGLCETCKWWERATIVGMGGCFKCTDTNVFRDDDGFSGLEFEPIRTGPKFGCIHHEAKE
jgi:hypothetical protein